MSPVRELRTRVQPILQNWGDRLRADHPDVRTNVFDASVGSTTDFQGHVIGIDCLFTSSAADKADNVALEIVLSHLHETPMIVCADVTWGHPSGHVEAELLPNPIEFSQEHLADLIERLPALFVALQGAVRRGHPPD
jgi:hypothetical protein